MPTNKEIIANAYAETAKGNGRPFVEAMHDDMTWRCIGTNSWSGTFASKQTILREIFGRMHPKVEGRGLTIPTHIFADGDHVIVQARGSNALKSGKRYNNDYCFVIRMQDGKMIQLTEYLDTELVTEGLGKRV